MAKQQMNDQMSTALAGLLDKQPPKRKLGEQHSLNGSPRYVTPSKGNPFAKTSERGRSTGVKAKAKARPLRDDDQERIKKHEEQLKAEKEGDRLMAAISAMTEAKAILEPASKKKNFFGKAFQPLHDTAAPPPQAPAIASDWRAQKAVYDHQPQAVEPQIEAVAEEELERLTAPGIMEELPPLEIVIAAVPEDTMREQYDFSNGVIGKYAATAPIEPPIPAPPPPPPPQVDLDWLEKKSSPFITHIQAMIGPAKDRKTILADENVGLRKQLAILEQQRDGIANSILNLTQCLEKNLDKNRQLDEYLELCAMLAEQSAGLEELMQFTRSKPAAPSADGKKRGYRRRFDDSTTYSTQDCLDFFLASPAGNYSLDEIRAAAPAGKRQSAKLMASQRVFALKASSKLLQVTTGVYRLAPGIRPV